MRRSLEQALLAWYKSPIRLPLLIRGARQVGKTFLIEAFGHAYFKTLITINFEFQPEFCSCFDSLDPQTILEKIGLFNHQKIIPKETLLFLDEIQECPRAILAMRYFKEKLSTLAVIGAGSLLELMLQDFNFRMPVGRIQYLFLRPLSFQEFLYAAGLEEWGHFLKNVPREASIPDALHQKLLAWVKKYMVLGGMPEVLAYYIQHQELTDWQEIAKLQAALVQTYRQDFGKYATKMNYVHLQKTFMASPHLMGQHLKYARIDPETPSRNLKEAIHLLKLAGLLYPVYTTQASGLPLVSHINERIFKLLFLDIGLAGRQMGLSIETLLREELFLRTQGNLTEQFVGQEFLAYAEPFEEPLLYFWVRNTPGSQAEVDYVLQHEDRIIPVEVKSGSTGHLRSLHRFLEEKKAPIGIRISEHPLSFDGKILSLPFYLMSEWKRLTFDKKR